MHPLGGPRLKVSIAKDKSDQLETEITSTLGNCDLYRLVPETDPNTGKSILKADFKRRDSEPVWGVEIGLIAHLLRSALDNVVFQLALKNTATPYDRICFPIFQIKAEFFDRTHKRVTSKGTVKGILQDLNPRHIAMIESMQPYEGAKLGIYDPLWLLYQINNSDKHRLVQVAVPCLSGGTIDLTIEAGTITSAVDILVDLLGPYEHGAPVITLPPQVHVNPNVTFHVRFGDESLEPVRRGEVFNILRQILKRVDGVVEGFAPEFPT